MIINPYREHEGEYDSVEDTLYLVTVDDHTLCFAHPQLRDDERIVTKAVEHFGFALSFASERLKKRKEIVLEAVKNDSTALKFADDCLKNDPEFLKECIEIDGWFAMSYITEEMMNNDEEEMKKLITDAVKKHGENLQYKICDFLRHDKEIVLQAVSQDGRNIEFVDRTLKLDRSVILAAAKHGKYSDIHHVVGESYLKQTYGKDKEMIHALVEANGMLLKLGSTRIRKDPQVVFSAVRQNGMSLQFVASKTLRDDDDGSPLSIALVALTNTQGRALLYASSRLRNDENFVKKALEMGPMNLQYASERIRKDEELVFEAAKRDKNALGKADHSCLINSSLIRRLIDYHKDGSILWKLASESLYYGYDDDPKSTNLSLMIHSLKHLSGNYRLERLPFEKNQSLKRDPVFLAAALRDGHLFVVDFVDRQLLQKVQFIRECLEIPMDEEEEEEGEGEEKGLEIVSERTMSRIRVKRADYYQKLLFRKLMTKATEYYWTRDKRVSVGQNRGFMLWCAERGYDQAIEFVDNQVRKSKLFMYEFLALNISGIHHSLEWENYLHTLLGRSPEFYSHRVSNFSRMKISERCERWILDVFHDQKKYRKLKREDKKIRSEFVGQEMMLRNDDGDSTEFIMYGEEEVGGERKNQSLAIMKLGFDQECVLGKFFLLM